MPCGHTFCGICLDVASANGTHTCQKCRGQINSVIQNICVENAVASEKGKCRGCGQGFSLEHAEADVRQCGEIEGACPLCDGVYKRKENEEHRRQCPKEKLTCECGFTMERESEANHKDKICRFGVVVCPLKCGQVLKR